MAKEEPKSSNFNKPSFNIKKFDLSGYDLSQDNIKEEPKIFIQILFYE